MSASAEQGAAGKVPIIDFDPGPPYGFIHTIAFMCYPDAHVRAKRVLAIATAVVGEFKAFGWRLCEIASGRDVPPPGTLSAMLEPTRRNPILAKPIVELIRAIIYRHGSTGFDHVGTERDFWRLCHRREPRSFIFDAVNMTFNFMRTDLISSEAAGDYRALATADPFAQIMPKIMSLLLGDPMIAGMAIVLFDGIGRDHPNDASRAMARRIITERARIDQKRISRERQIRAWGEWGPLLPLWAGVIAEARPWHPRNLFDEYRIQRMMLDVIADDERRARAFAYAAWFSQVVTIRAHRRDQLPYLMRPDQIARIECDAREPPTVPALEEALGSLQKPSAVRRKS